MVAIALVLEAAFRPGGDKGLLLVAVATVLAGTGALLRPDPRDGLATWATTVFGALYVGLIAFVLQVATWPRRCPPARRSRRSAPNGAGSSSSSSPCGATTPARTSWAAQIGRHKFLTHISPSKSIEGLAGGLVATTVVTALMLAGLGQNPVGAIVLGPLVGLAAQAGDLAESMLKRAAGEKDSGTLIPGHGGILDRIDSFLFAGPVVALYVLAIAG